MVMEGPVTNDASVMESYCIVMHRTTQTIGSSSKDVNINLLRCGV